MPQTNHIKPRRFRYEFFATFSGYFSIQLKTPSLAILKVFWNCKFFHQNLLWHFPSQQDSAYFKLLAAFQNTVANRILNLFVYFNHCTRYIGE